MCTSSQYEIATKSSLDDILIMQSFYRKPTKMIAEKSRQPGSSRTRCHKLHCRDSTALPQIITRNPATRNKAQFGVTARLYTVSLYLSMSLSFRIKSCRSQSIRENSGRPTTQDPTVCCCFFFFCCCRRN